MITSRRSFLRTFASLIAAPAIVQATSIMPVKAFFDPRAALDTLYYRTNFDEPSWYEGYEPVLVDKPVLPEREILERWSSREAFEAWRRECEPGLTNLYRVTRRDAADADLDRAIDAAFRGEALPTNPDPYLPAAAAPGSQIRALNVQDAKVRLDDLTGPSRPPHFKYRTRREARHLRELAEQQR